MFLADNGLSLYSMPTNLCEDGSDYSYLLIIQHPRLTDQQFKSWVGKRYLVLVEVSQVAKVTPFQIDKSDYGNMDDWLPVGDIGKVRCTNS